MSSFLICNREPAPHTQANVGDSVRCSLRSVNGILRDSTRAYLGTGGAFYNGGVLPELSTTTQFSLQALNGAPKKPVTRSIELDDSLKIVKSLPSNQEGLYFFGGLEAPMLPDAPLMLEFTLRARVVDMVPDFTQRTGVMVGVFINNSGFVIHFCTNMATSWIEMYSAARGAVQRINFPSTDYLASYSWDGRTDTYKVLWHPRENLVQLYVSSGDDDTPDTLLISGHTTDFPTVPVEERLSNQPWACFGHGIAAAQSISYWSHVSLYNEADSAIADGAFAGGHTGFLTTDNTNLYTPTAMLRAHDLPWNLLPSSFGELAGTEVLGNTAVTLTKTEPTKSFGYYRRAPRYSGSPVVFDFRVSGSVNHLVDSEASGIEVFVTDETRMIRVGFLISNDVYYVGLLTNAAAPELLASYLSVATSWKATRTYRLQVDPGGNVILKTFEGGEELILATTPYSNMPLLPAPGAGVLPSSALGVVLSGVYAESYATLNIEELRYSVNLRVQEMTVPASPWIYSGPSPQSSYVRSEGGLLHLDGSTSASAINFYRADSMTGEEGISLEFRMRVASYQADGLSDPLRYTTGVGVSIEDTARQIALVFADGGPELGHVVFFARSTDWNADLLALRSRDAEMLTRYKAVDWSALHTYRIERALNGALALYLDDSLIPALSYPDHSFVYPASPGSCYLRFGALQAGRYSHSEWQWFRYAVSDGLNLKMFPLLTQDEILQRFDKMMNVIVWAEDA